MLLTENNPKTKKGEKDGYVTAIQHLAPSNLSGYNVCTSSSRTCRRDCLFFCGRGQMRRVSEARVKKTINFFTNRQNHIQDLHTELIRFEKRAARLDLIPAVRLNGLSDVMWERIAPELFSEFSAVQFYDYTKHFLRMKRWLAGELPANLYLTFSRSENNEHEAMQIIRAGGNVAVLFRDGIYPAKWKRFRVIDGDESDLRFLDERPRIVGLRPKGPMVHDKSGYVIDPPNGKGEKKLC